VSHARLAITRRPGPDLARCELTHLARQPIDAEAAARQHAGYQARIAALGLEVIDLPPLAGHPDAVFVEDAGLALPEAFVLCAPGAASRAGEVDSLTAAFPADRPVLRLQGEARLDGGDVLTLGRRIWIGLSGRSNRAAVSQLAALLAPFGYAVEGVRLAGALHLKTAVTAPDEETLLVNRAWVDPAQFGARRLIEVDPAEPFAANCLAVGGKVFLQSAFPATAERLAASGFEVGAIHVPELAKAEAGLTCMSIIVPPAL
jgi:dimethylargininase